METRVCRKCLVKKPLVENFELSYRNNGRHRSTCKGCRRQACTSKTPLGRKKRNAALRADRLIHPQKYRDRENARKEQKKEQRHAKRLANLEETRKKDLQYFYSNRNNRRQSAHTYRINNSEKLNTHHAQYIKLHPEINQAACARRRARKAGAPLNDFTAAQWVEMQAAYNHRCVYCGKRAKGHLTQDHVTALSQGGSHTFSNIVPACGPCNSRKHAGPPLAAVQTLLLTLAPSKRTSVA